MLANLWYWLTGLCRHNYETFNKGQVLRGGKMVGNFYEQRCKHCGKLREVQLNG